MLFRSSDSIWSAGQYICYNLYESSFTVSPSSLQVSALGEDTLSLSITCFPANTDWKLTSPVSWLKLSLNKDGSDSSSSVSGTGDDKVYVIIDTFILNTMDDRTAVIEADDETYNIQKQVNVTQYCMKNVPTDNDKKSYAGAFWRRSQRGERLIYIASTIGEWKAFVYWMDDRWNEGDIILKAESFSLPAEVVPAGDDTPFVTGSATSITGNTNSEGAISFVVGLNDYYTPTSEYPARYALLAITWDEGLSTQFVFLRQGEDPDYVMRPTDEYGDDQSWASSSNWRPNAVKVSPYNLTADTLNAQCNQIGRAHV